MTLARSWQDVLPTIERAAREFLHRLMMLPGNCIRNNIYTSVRAPSSPGDAGYRPAERLPRRLLFIPLVGPPKPAWGFGAV